MWGGLRGAERGNAMVGMYSKREELSKKKKWAGDVIQSVECMPTIYEAQYKNPTLYKIIHDGTQQ